MTVSRNLRRLLLAVGVTLIILPAAISDGHERAQPEKRHEPHGAKTVQYVFKGTFHAGDSSVTVLKGNKHVRRAGLVGETVVFDLSGARIRVADNNVDGKRDLADVQDGDKVVVQARLPRTEPGAGPFAARKLVDQSHKKGKADGEHGEKGEHGDD